MWTSAITVFLLVTTLCNAADACQDGNVVGLGYSNMLTILRECFGIPLCSGQKWVPGSSGMNGEAGDAGKQGQKEQTGSKKDHGEAGQTGEKGEAGDAGIQGEKEQTGSKKDHGEAGQTGEKGEAGDAGIQGQKEQTESKGAPGEAGQTGEKGEAGDAGIQGEKGQTGSKGAPGEAGQTGEKVFFGIGEAGDAGIKGQKEQTGSKGDPGEAGQTGEKGVAGDAGIQGEKGQTGSKGDPGEAGQTGEKGDKGDIGTPEKIYGDKGDKGTPEKLYAGRNCKELLDRGSFLSGWYTIYPDSKKPLTVLCDMDTDRGGWIVFQRRWDGSVDFFRDWNSYKRGFGSQLSEFWLGNDNIHNLTSSGTFQLRIDLTDFENNNIFAAYDGFGISGELENYKLMLGTFTGGSAGDSLSYHNGQYFSTKDKDNDQHSTNCAEEFKGAWWYRYCHFSNLNGLYLRGQHSSYADGINWETGKGSYYSYKVTEMKFRPV
ncbi:uncharacterized protein LOC142472374 isoform X3 [Ascaphus truei]|uniref:uncharacterized protein LOC142472374 isoform X3 n=1 Tax=Ascaphus truei TaxID=8439 RepID=UPI003F599AD1